MNEETHINKTDDARESVEEYSQAHVKQILMQRDGMTSEEADDLIVMTCEDLLDCVNTGDYYAATDVMMNNLGLEPDYLEGMLS